MIEIPLCGNILVGKYVWNLDYFSQFFEVDFLQSTTSSQVIHKLKAHFARYGIPSEFYSDNGPQFSCKEFRDFCKQYEIRHETSSPGNAKSNGASEAAVKVAKGLMKKSIRNKEDPYLSLLAHRNTPQENIDATPAQRLIGRRTRTLLPTVPSLLDPQPIPYRQTIEQRENKQQKMSSKFDSKRPLSPLKPNDVVRMQPIDGSKIWKEAQVLKPVENNPRSYIVKDNSGAEYRRDRQFLRHKPSSPITFHDLISSENIQNSTSNNNNPQISCSTNKATLNSKEPPPEAISLPDTPVSPMKTRSGRVIRKPERY